jgi:hypothetical protein
LDFNGDAQSLLVAMRCHSINVQLSEGFLKPRIFSICFGL